MVGILTAITPTELSGVALDTAKGITDFGMLAMTGAFFLVLSGLMWVAVFRWFKGIIDNVLLREAERSDELLEAVRGLERTMVGVQDAVHTMHDAMIESIEDISGQLAPETLLRVKNFSNVHFDLSAERVCRIIEKVREENHIADKEATRTKIGTLLKNLHDDRNTRFDTFRYRGKLLSYYVNPLWVDWVSAVVEREIYASKISHARERTNVEAVYERIKIDFYQRMSGQ